jgi:uncharacterized protein
MIISTGKEKYFFGKNIGLIMPFKKGKKIEKLFGPPLEYTEGIKAKLQEDISDESIMKDLSNTRLLTLQLTQNCNLRCSYCTFSGIYESSRTHRSNKMTIDTARQAIDFFLENISSQFRSENDRKIIISFYGGESLIEYKTIIDSIDYARKKANKWNFDIDFSITTNGVLLTPDKVKKFVDESVLLDISLDGPQEEHDRFRIDIRGEGTFLKIMDNVKQIKEKYPDYFKRNVQFFVTIHPSHNLSEVEEYFLTHPDLFNGEKFNINAVNLEGLDGELKEEWSESRREQSEQKHSILQRDKWFYEKLVAEPIDNIFQPGKGTNVLLHNYSFTGACFPGGLRLFVDVDGTLHICEKMDESFSIGDIDKGYDLKKIKHILKLWINEIKKMGCWTCDCVHMCSFCYATNGSNGHVSINNKHCDALRKTMKTRIHDYLSLKESEDEKTSAVSYDNIAGLLESL